MSALTAPLASLAQQQPAKVARIGFLGLASASNTATEVGALRAGLRELGYVEGKNLIIEFRWAESSYDRLPDLAAELVQLKVDVIVTHGTPGPRAAKQATATIPIVMAHSGDAVASGLVASLARPGGNVTGSTIFVPELMLKRLELLKEAIPRITQVGVLMNAANPQIESFKAMETAAKTLKVGLQRFDVRIPGDFAEAFTAIGKRRLEAIVIYQEAMLNANPRAIADLATKQRLASVGIKELAEAGGLIGYGVDLVAMFQRAAYFVDKILKGAKPADIPVERPTKFELVINMKTAKALGLKIPQSILVRADKVIE